MSRTVGIFAHFDPDGLVDANTLEIVRCLKEVCDEVSFITTSDVDFSKISFPEGVRAWRRPNIGYDFYSYKTGLVRALSNPNVDRIFLVNSSFLVLDTAKFRACLQAMITLAQGADAIGASESYQMARHLQSYLLLFGPAAVRSPVLSWYVNALQPQNAKIDLILNYELGLSGALSEAGLRLAAVFEAQPKGDQDNPVHAQAKQLADATGIVKTEVLRDNQHGIDTTFVRELGGVEAREGLAALVERYKFHYVVGSDKMTSLKTAIGGPPELRSAKWGHPHQPGVRIAVALHLFYSDLADEFCSYLSNIVEPFDLYVTTPFEKEVPFIVNMFSRVASSVTVAVCENRGRDIGPFVALYRSGKLDDYVAVLKLHSKKSRYSAQGDEWRHSILGALMGTSYAVLRSIDLLQRNDVGMVGPHNYYLTDASFWGGNRPGVVKLLENVNGMPAAQCGDLGFFAGSMFWFKPSAFRHLQQISGCELDFEPENGAQDGTLAHVIERAFAPLVRAAGFRTTTIYLDGQEIHDIPNKSNRVPVLDSSKRRAG